MCFLFCFCPWRAVAVPSDAWSWKWSNESFHITFISLFQTFCRMSDSDYTVINRFAPHRLSAWNTLINKQPFKRTQQPWNNNKIHLHIHLYADISLNYTHAIHSWWWRTATQVWIRGQRRHPEGCEPLHPAYQPGQLQLRLAGWTGHSSQTTTALLFVLCEDLLLYVTVTEERAGRLLDPADVPWVGFAAQPRCRSISSEFLRPDERREAKGSRPTQRDGAVMKSSTWTRNSCPADGMFYISVR